MKLEEAILSIAFQIRPPFIEPIGEDITALKLGLEAMKREIRNRRMRGGVMVGLLPGETEE